MKDIKYMKDIKELDWVEIFLWYKCNINCEFCFQKKDRLIHKTKFKKSKVISLIDNWYWEWKRFIIFSWWEPTLDLDLPFYIDYSKKIGYTYIRVHTNWFRFQNYNYLLDLYKKGLSWITISIHWYWIIHDKVTWVNWSFNIIKKALLNFEKIINLDSSFIVDVNTVIFKWNYSNLLKLYIYLFRFNIVRYQINYSSSLDMFNIDEKKMILVKYNKIKNNLKKILIYSYKINKKVVIDSIPYCILWKEYSLFIDNNIKNDRESFSLNWDHEYTYSDTYNEIKLEKCKKCTFSNKCRWIPLDYYEVFWDNDIKPF